MTEHTEQYDTTIEQTPKPSEDTPGSSKGWGWGRAALKLAVIAVIAGVGAKLWLAPTPDVFAQAPSTLDAAIEQAREEGKPVIAVATSDFCAPCQFYKRGALATEPVQAWIRNNAVPFFTRIEWDSDDARKLGKSNGPVPATMVLIDGEVVAERLGPVPADELIAWFEDVVPPSAASASVSGAASR